MAALGPFLSPFVSVGSQLTGAKSCTISYNAEAVDGTSFGDGTRINAAGLKAWSATVETNYQTSEDLFALIGTTVAFSMRPTTAAVGATNYSYAGSAMVESWELGGGVGDQLVATIGIVSAGALTATTS